MSQIAFIGDDINDIRGMSHCGYTACPQDASPEVKKTAHYICEAFGGNGAVREFSELLLKAKE